MHIFSTTIYLSQFFVYYFFAICLLLELCTTKAFILQELPLYYNDRVGSYAGQPRQFSDTLTGNSIQNADSIQFGRRNGRAYNLPKWNRLNRYWLKNDVS